MKKTDLNLVTLVYEIETEALLTQKSVFRRREKEEERVITIEKYQTDLLDPL